MKIIDENLPEPAGFRILLKPREIGRASCRERV